MFKLNFRGRTPQNHHFWKKGSSHFFENGSRITLSKGRQNLNLTEWCSEHYDSLFQESKNIFIINLRVVDLNPNRNLNLTTFCNQKQYFVVFLQFMRMFCRNFIENRTGTNLFSTLYNFWSRNRRGMIDTGFESWNVEFFKT